MSNQRDVEKQALKLQILNSTNIPESSLCERELTLGEVRAMSAREYYFHSIYNSKNVELALSSESRKTAGKAELERIKIKNFWKTVKTASGTQEHEAILQQVRNFVARYPQFDGRVQENRDQIIDLIEKRGQLIDQFSLVSAFETLAAEGKLYLNPEAIGLEGSESVKGRVLITRPDFYKFLQPAPILNERGAEQQRIARLSADEYAAEFLKKDEQFPPIIQRRIEGDIREFCSKHRNYDPTPEGKEILLSWIREQRLHVCHDSLEASWAANQEKLHAANCIFDEGPSIPVRYNASTLVDHRKPYIPTIERPITLEPSPTAKRIEMDKLLALPADEFQRVVNGTPGLRELLDGE